MFALVFVFEITIKEITYALIFGSQERVPDAQIFPSVGMRDYLVSGYYHLTPWNIISYISHMSSMAIYGCRTISTVRP